MIGADHSKRQAEGGDYRFDLVHHGVGGSETVLYAY
jgi:hypothetical protein